MLFSHKFTNEQVLFSSQFFVIIEKPNQTHWDSEKILKNELTSKVRGIINDEGIYLGQSTLCESCFTSQDQHRLFRTDV